MQRMTSHQAERYLAEHSPSSMMLEPRALYSPALIGVTNDGGHVAAVYCVLGILDALQAAGMGEDEAREFFDYNIERAVYGSRGPVFMYGGEE